MIQGVLLGVLLAGGPGSQFSITYETRIDEDGRLVCTAIQDTSGVSMLRQDPSSGDNSDIDYLAWWDDPPDHTAREGNIQIRYYNFPSDEFREAFQHAVAIWDSVLDFAVSPKIVARYLPQPSGFSPAAYAQVSIGCINSEPFCRTTALENHVKGRDVNSGFPEVIVTLNDLEDSQLYPGGWHLEKDWSPAPDSLDLITVVLHEMTHSFGFSTMIRRSGCCAARNGAPEGAAFVYDHFVWTQQHGRLIDLPSPSEELLEALGTGEGALWGQLGWENLHGEPMLTLEVGMGPTVIGGIAFSGGGVDVYHMSSSAYPKGTVNSLMGIGHPGVALRHPGPIVMAMLYDMGWDLKTDIPTALPPPPPRRPGLPPLYPPSQRPDVRLEVIERGAWHQILVHWDEVPNADRYATRLTSRSGTPRSSGDWRGYYSQPPVRYLVRKSWGPFTIEVWAVNAIGVSPKTTATWPDQ